MTNIPQGTKNAVWNSAERAFTHTRVFRGEVPGLMLKNVRSAGILPVDDLGGQSELLQSRIVGQCGFGT